jgi:hypothetical protein
MSRWQTPQRAERMRVVATESVQWLWVIGRLRSVGGICPSFAIHITDCGVTVTTCKIRASTVISLDPGGRLRLTEGTHGIGDLAPASLPTR